MHVSVHACLATALKGTRGELEGSLRFAGFALVDSPLKRDSASVVARLLRAACHCTMITGDGALTAAAVARRCSAELSSPLRVQFVAYEVCVCLSVPAFRSCGRLSERCGMVDRPPAETLVLIARPPGPESKPEREASLAASLAWTPLVAGFDDDDNDGGGGGKRLIIPFAAGEVKK